MDNHVCDFCGMNLSERILPMHINICKENPKNAPIEEKKEPIDPELPTTQQEQNLGDLNSENNIQPTEELKVEDVEQKNAPIEEKKTRGRNK